MDRGIGSLQFIDVVKKQLGTRAKHRKIKEEPFGTTCILKEPAAAYNHYFEHGIKRLALKKP